MKFTVEEFNIMLDQVLGSDVEPSMRYDMLCRICERVIKQPMEIWCRNCRLDSYTAEDLYQEALLKIMKNSVYACLSLENGKTPECFSAYMKKCARNIFVDYLRKNNKMTVQPDEFFGDMGGGGSFNSSADNEEVLRHAVKLVLSFDKEIHITMSWIAVLIFMNSYEYAQRYAIGDLAEYYGHQKLNSLYDMIKQASNKLAWLRLDSDDMQKIENALRKKDVNGVIVGEKNLEEFFMSNKSVQSGKKSICDWMNRINNKLRGNEEFRKHASG